METVTLTKKQLLGVLISRSFEDVQAELDAYGQGRLSKATTEIIMLECFKSFATEEVKDV